MIFSLPLSLSVSLPSSLQICLSVSLRLFSNVCVYLSCYLFIYHLFFCFLSFSYPFVILLFFVSDFLSFFSSSVKVFHVYFSCSVIVSSFPSYRLSLYFFLVFPFLFFPSIPVLQLFFLVYFNFFPSPFYNVSFPVVHSKYSSARTEPSWNYHPINACLPCDVMIALPNQLAAVMTSRSKGESAAVSSREGLVDTC